MMYLHLDVLSESRKLLIKLAMISISLCRCKKSLKPLIGFIKRISLAYIVSLEPSESSRLPTQLI